MGNTAEKIMTQAIENMTVKQLRRYAIDSGYGITYLSERRKEEILRAIKEIDSNRQARTNKA